MRGSGLHHSKGSSRPNHGKIPCAYASISRAGERSPPAASNPFGCCSASSGGGNGSSVSRKGITVLRPDLAAAAALFTSPPVTRFAPSPTGYLHLCHIVNAIYTWGVARALGGRVLLRLEDHDRIRSRTVYEDAILEDLDWLGFEPDEGRMPLVRQSDAPAIYRDVLSDLKRTQHVYPCDCSRTDIGGER